MHDARTVRSGERVSHLLGNALGLGQPHMASGVRLWRICPTEVFGIG